MHIVITGGAGFIGKKLAAALLASDGIALEGQPKRPLERLTLFDVVEAAEGLPADTRIRTIAGDITDRAQIDELISEDVDAVFHLAAIVSANAEADFDLGMAVNLDGTRHILEACRRLGSTPRVVFASSVAVYGGDMPETGYDDLFLNPQTSYGAQKAAGELLVNDYSRKGFVDGRALRLPTIVVRPGKPNKAASTFASSIIREPLAGEPAVCPVSRDSVMYILSPSARGRGLPPRPGASRRDLRPGAHADAARHLGVDRRGRSRPCRGRGTSRRGSHPLGARRSHPEDRLRLDAGFRRQARQKAGLSARRQHRRDHPGAYRG